MLFEIGSLADEMRLLLDGECAFYTRMSNDDDISPVEVEYERKVRSLPEDDTADQGKSRRSVFKGVPKARQTWFTHVEKRGGKMFAFYCGRILKQISTFTRGQLISASSMDGDMTHRQSATVVCTRSSYFLTIDRQTYRVAWYKLECDR